ncbi:hypothetical protein [Dichotomicrobium thermohalophilum]|uniref:Sel1 repeat-containing protein n=1 Tax=Dichotomicrobium thermohalophilum TaxID=933063 RepID=A0A397Q389_9HYPH|nr:hypothetical protein [Dichotomicrobium thermohalophilum]RIA55508.1 hypothetical protein BXY53_0574 [Dichotomicrobium thermohalophilum]
MSSSTSPKTSGDSNASLKTEPEAQTPEAPARASETDNAKDDTTQTVKDERPAAAGEPDREEAATAASAEAKPTNLEDGKKPAGAEAKPDGEIKSETAAEEEWEKAEDRPEDRDAMGNPNAGQTAGKQTSEPPAEAEAAAENAEVAAAETDGAATEASVDEQDEEEPLDLRALFASSEPEFADPTDTFELAREAKPETRAATQASGGSASRSGVESDSDDESDLPFDLPVDGMLNATPADSQPAKGAGLTGFGEDAPQADTNAFGGAPGDPLADAVQSALRSVYGDDEKGENHGYTREDAEGTASGPILQWAGANVPDEAHDAAVDEENFDAEPGDPRQDTAAIDEETTEAVLSYLYEHVGDEASSPNTPQAAADEPRARTDFAADGPDDAWAAPEPAETPEPSVNAADYRTDAMGAAHAPESAQPADPAPSPEPAGTFHPPIDVGAGESEASGKLLGAAGLGLIGGIAAAGVAAVFVFNSFVTQQEPATTTPSTSSQLEETATSEPERGAPASDTREDQVAEAVSDPSATGQTTEESTQSAPVEPRADTQSETAQTAAATQPDTPATAPDAGGGESKTAALIDASSVSGRANEAIPLALSVPSGDGDRFIRMTGLPDGVKLSAGVDTGNGSWLLSAGRAKDLTLTVPDGFTGVFTLDAQLLGADARTPLGKEVAFDVEVAGAQVAEASETRTAAVGAETSPAATEPQRSPIERAENLIREGDVLAAREILRSETEDGSAAAALALGTSYDPRTFTGLTSANASPDATEAFRWYQRAAELGNPNGSSQISELKAWLLR